jgi:hypothetical protein
MNKYPNGYLPKIVYHITKGAWDKVQYFYDRQVETYGPLTEADRKVMGDLFQIEFSK